MCWAWPAPNGSPTVRKLSQVVVIANYMASVLASVGKAV